MSKRDIKHFEFETFFMFENVCIGIQEVQKFNVLPFLMKQYLLWSKNTNSEPTTPAVRQKQSGFGCFLPPIPVSIERHRRRRKYLRNSSILSFFYSSVVVSITSGSYTAHNIFSPLPCSTSSGDKPFRAHQSLEYLVECLCYLLHGMVFLYLPF